MVATAFGTPEVVNNGGTGVILDVGSIGRLAGMTVQGNNVGFLALNNSTAEFVRDTADNVVSGNAFSRGGGNTDLGCDSTSVVVGDFSMVGVNNCSSTGGGVNN